MVPDVAVMFAVPSARVVARPAALMLAVDGTSEIQLATDVRSFVLPSVKVPIAVNCWLLPKAIEGFAGASAIDTNAAVLTVRVVLPTIEPEVAEIAAVPVVMPVANPI
jgi:hypothetical protein